MIDTNIESAVFKLRHFELHEFACKDGCGAMPKMALMLAADELREQWGLPIHIVSGKRCEAHNRRVGGAKYSYHVKGLAIDIRIDDKSRDRDRLLGIAGSLGFRGFGRYETFTHLDLRTRYTSWVG